MSQEKRTFPAISIYKFSVEFGKMVFRELISLKQVREAEGENADKVIEKLKCNSFNNTYEERKIISGVNPNDFYIRRDMLTMMDNDLIKKSVRVNRKVVNKPTPRAQVLARKSKTIKLTKKVRTIDPEFDVTTIHIPKVREFIEIESNGMPVDPDKAPLQFLGGAKAAEYFGISKSVLYKNKKETIEINGKLYRIKKYLSK